MKRYLLIIVCILLITRCGTAQVTRINNNNSLTPAGILNANLVLLTSDNDSAIWATNGTLAGTIKLSSTIKAGEGITLGNKYIFAGRTQATGLEIYVTDGTASGTQLLKDIYSGAMGSELDGDFALLGNYVYFTAVTATEGRELWRSDGTAANTRLVKDIVAGPASGFVKDSSELTSTGSYLLFDVKNAANGLELWKSDGTAGNTALLKDIYSGTGSSYPNKFFVYKSNMVFFAATDATHGNEIWTTDGSAAKTVLLKDINPGKDSSTYISVEFAPGFSYPFPLFLSFHVFNNRLFFMANDGAHGSAVWVTDGTSGNTSFVKALDNQNAAYDFFNLLDAVNLPGKFIFPFSNGDDRFELWQSDGTPAGTNVFKSYQGNEDKIPPFIDLNYSFTAGSYTITYPLFNGKFFFSASGTEGNELWASDGTVANTKIVKDIHSGAADAITNVGSYIYTKQGFYFAASDGTHGNELWKTDGTAAGTVMVKDIFQNSGNSDPELGIIVNNKILFTATDGDDPDNTDLFVVDGVFNALPVQLLNFTVTPKGADGILEWSTAQEINSNNFTIESSDDAQHWNTIGLVAAAGNSSQKIDYSFTDVNVMNSGKSIVYYRLISKDIDGKSQASDVISLKINGSQWNVQLLANPVGSNLRFIVSGMKGATEISVNDMSGKTVYRKQVRNQDGLVSLPINLQAGVYILVAKHNDEVKSMKFIKE